MAVLVVALETADLAGGYAIVHPGDTLVLEAHVHLHAMVAEQMAAEAKRLGLAGIFVLEGMTLRGVIRRREGEAAAYGGPS